MTVVGEAFIQIRPAAGNFEKDVTAAAKSAAVRAAKELDQVPVEPDTTGLVEEVGRAADRAADRARVELDAVPVSPDVGGFVADVERAAERAHDQAAGELRGIPASADGNALVNDVRTAADRAAAAAEAQLADVDVQADTTGLVNSVDRAMDTAERRVRTGADRMGRETGGALTGLGTAVAKGLAVAGGVQQVFSAIEVAREANRVANQTEAVIRSTGGVAKVTAADVDRLAASIKRKSAVDDEQTKKAANLLLTFTNVRNEVGRGNDIFNQAVQIGTDMAAALGQEAAQGAIQLGKALNDPIAGVSALAEVGVTFTEGQKEQIRTLVESGRIMEGQKIILAELAKEFGGSAASQTDDLDRLAVKYDDFKERVGDALLGVIGFVSDLPGPVQIAGVALGGLAVTAVGVAKVADAVSSLSGRLADMAANGSRIPAVAGGLGRFAAGAAGIGLLAGVVNELDDALDDLRATPPPDVSELTNSLVRFAQEGKPSGAVAREFGRNLDGLATKVRDLKKLGGSDGFASGFRVGREALQDIDALDDSLASLVRSGQAGVADTIVKKLADQARVSVPELRELLDAYRGSLTEVDTQQRLAGKGAEAMAGGLDGATDPLADVSEGLDDVAESAGQAVDPLDEFRTALDKALGIQVDAVRATIDYTEAVDNLRQSVAENGRTLDLSTEQGRANQRAILAAIDAARAHTEALAEQGASADDVRRTFGEHRSELEQVFRQLGLNKEQTAGYRAILDSIPGSVFTQLSVRDAEGRAKVDAFVKMLDEKLGREVIVTVKLDPATGKLVTTTGREFREHGGPVYAGRAYVVGERRAELFVAPSNGWIMPSIPKAASGAIVQASPGGSVVNVAEGGRDELITPIPPGLLRALEQIAAGGGVRPFMRDLILHPGSGDPYAISVEVVREMQAAVFRSTGVLT